MKSFAGCGDGGKIPAASMYSRQPWRKRAIQVYPLKNACGGTGVSNEKRKPLHADLNSKFAAVSQPCAGEARK
jgi:hypothetical protein